MPSVSSLVRAPAQESEPPLPFPSNTVPISSGPYRTYTAAPLQTSPSARCRDRSTSLLSKAAASLRTHPTHPLPPRHCIPGPSRSNTAAACPCGPFTTHPPCPFHSHAAASCLRTPLHCIRATGRPSTDLATAADHFPCRPDRCSNIRDRPFPCCRCVALLPDATCSFLTMPSRSSAADPSSSRPMASPTVEATPVQPTHSSSCLSLALRFGPRVVLTTRGQATPFHLA